MSVAWSGASRSSEHAGATATARTGSLAVWALTCAVASFVLPLLPAVLALGLAHRAERLELVDGLEGRDLVRTARVVAWLNICLSLTAGVALVVVAAVTSVRNGA